MVLLGANQLTKAYGTKTLLHDVSLSIHEHERVGVIGPNGAGKSTLLKILAGIEVPDEGSVARRKDIHVEYLHQEPSLPADRTARDVVEGGLALWLAAKKRHEALSEKLGEPGANLESILHDQESAAREVERLGGWDRSHEVERVLEALGVVELDALVGTLSGGMRRRVAIARLLVACPDLAILDEPSNHLDADTIAWLETYLLETFRGAVLVVTHDRWLLDQLVDRTIELDQGTLHAYEGGYESYLAAKAERLALLDRTERNRQNFLRRELEWLRRQPKARTTKQKARIHRAEAAKDARPLKEQGELELRAAASRSGKSVLDARGLGLKMGERWLVRGLDLSLVPGDRLGIVGPNGVGKTTLLRAILGEHPVSEGTLVRGKNTRIGYLDQTRTLLAGDESVLEVIARASPTVDGARVDPRVYLERFQFDGAMARQPVSALSGGERARVALACLLAQANSLLLLDEPTNDLDTATLAAMEEMLASYEGSVLVVTHDRYFLDRVATGILAFETDAHVVQYAGAYQAYAGERLRAERTRQEEAAAARAQVKREVRRRESATSKAGISKNEQRELDGLPDRIEAAEKVVAATEAELGAPELYTARTLESDAKLADLRAKLAQVKGEAETLLARWEALEEKREARG